MKYYIRTLKFLLAERLLHQTMTYSPTVEIVVKTENRLKLCSVLLTAHDHLIFLGARLNLSEQF